MWWLSWLGSASFHSFALLAITTGSFGIFPTHQAEPPWFVYHLSSGESHQDQVTLQNEGDESVAVKIYPVDAIITGDGAFAMRDRLSPRTEVGKWVSIETNNLTVSPHSSLPVAFKVVLPKNAAVGPHYGGIVAELESSATPKALGFNVSVVHRLGVRIYETVPGNQKPSISLATKRYGHLILLKIKNTGNTVITPRGQITFDKTKLPIDANRSLSPGSTFSLLETLPTRTFLLRHYKITIQISDGSHASAHEIVTFWEINGKRLALLSIMVGIIAGVIFGFRRQKAGTPIGHGKWPRLPPR